MHDNKVKENQSGLSDFAQAILLKLLESEKGYPIKDGKLKVGSLEASSKVIDKLLSSDFVVKRRSRLLINAVGRAYIARMQHLHNTHDKRHSNGLSPYIEQHIGIENKAFVKASRKRAYRGNLAETPLGWLLRRKGRDGNSMISKEQFLAGERLREDFILSGISPHVTMNYDAVITNTANYHGGCGMTVADHTIAAKKRLDNALQDAGPGLGDILMWVCCHLDGLESAEKHLGWPVRSGKVVLSIALERLIYHYTNQ